MKNDSLEKLAYDLAKFEYDYDYYGFIDSFDDIFETEDEMFERATEDLVDGLQSSSEQIIDRLKEIIDNEKEELLWDPNDKEAKEWINRAVKLVSRVNDITGSGSTKIEKLGERRLNSGKGQIMSRRSLAKILSRELHKDIKDVEDLIEKEGVEKVTEFTDTKAEYLGFDKYRVFNSLKESISDKDYDELFAEFLDITEFDLEKYEDGYGLHDRQGANLGDIEGDRFDTAEEIVDRMDNYVVDYFLDDEEYGDYVSFQDFLDNGPKDAWDRPIVDMLANHIDEVSLDRVWDIFYS